MLCLKYVFHLPNHTASPALGNQVPFTMLTGSTPGISMLLQFHWYQKVYFCKIENSFPSESPEQLDYFVGFNEHVGHNLTYTILDRQSQKVLYCSEVCPADNNAALNLRANNKGDDDDTNDHGIICSTILPSINDPTPNTTPKPLEIINIDEWIGRNFEMHDKQDNMCKATITDVIYDFQKSLLKDPLHAKFKASLQSKSGKYDEMISYNQLLEHLECHEDQPLLWEMEKIIAHQGPLNQHDPNYQGSKYNVTVLWSNGERTDEPLSIIPLDAPVACTTYSKKKEILHLPGWKRFKNLDQQQGRMFTDVNKVKLRNCHTRSRFKYGIEIPRNYQDILHIDKSNGNTLWKDALKKAMDCMMQYKVFKDIGLASRVPQDYKNIRVHFVYDVKHDGRHRARLVADGHLTDVPVDSVYSGVVSLHGFRLLLFLAELNGLKVWGTDISSAHLEAYTKEKVCTITGPEFGPLEGHRLLVDRALYGLQSSGARWHDKFATCMRAEEFFPCRAEPDIWIRPADDHYEYVTVYVDDLAFAVDDPQKFIKTLQNKHNFKLKGSGPIDYHLEANFIHDQDGTLSMSPKKYITE